MSSSSDLTTCTSTRMWWHLWMCWYVDMFMYSFLQYEFILHLKFIRSPIWLFVHCMFFVQLSEPNMSTGHFGSRSIVLVSLPRKKNCVHFSSLDLLAFPRWTGHRPPRSGGEEPILPEAESWWASSFKIEPSGYFVVISLSSRKWFTWLSVAQPTVTTPVLSGALSQVDKGRSDELLCGWVNRC